MPSLCHSPAGAGDFPVRSRIRKSSPSHGKARRSPFRSTPSDVQGAWLRRGLDQPGGKLPLFDERGQRVKKPTVDACLKAGWAERWFDNPLKPDWLVCRLTEAGRTALGGHDHGDAASADEAEADARQDALI